MSYNHTDLNTQYYHSTTHWLVLGVVGNVLDCGQPFLGGDWLAEGDHIAQIWADDDGAHGLEQKVEGNLGNRELPDMPDHHNTVDKVVAGEEGKLGQEEEQVEVKDRNMAAAEVEGILGYIQCGVVVHWEYHHMQAEVQKRPSLFTIWNVT